MFVKNLSQIIFFILSQISQITQIFFLSEE